MKASFYALLCKHIYKAPKKWFTCLARVLTRLIGGWLPRFLPAHVTCRGSPGARTEDAVQGVFPHPPAATSRFPIRPVDIVMAEAPTSTTPYYSFTTLSRSNPHLGSHRSYFSLSDASCACLLPGSFCLAGSLVPWLLVSACACPVSLHTASCFLLLPRSASIGLSLVASCLNRLLTHLLCRPYSFPLLPSPGFAFPAARVSRPCAFCMYLGSLECLGLEI
jgi:hypothetical protein